MDELRQIYRQAMAGRIRELESALQTLATRAGEAEPTLRRVAHSLRGSGATYGFPEVSTAAAAVEEAAPATLAEATQRLLGVLRGVAAGGPVPGAAPAGETTTRVLAVDDDPEMQLLLRHVLAGGGREVVFAASLAEATSALAAARFDLVLLDLLLPDGDGRVLLRRLRMAPGASAVPVLVLSGRDGLAAREECLELGADDFIEKPFDPDRVRSAVLARLQPQGMGGT